MIYQNKLTLLVQQMLTLGRSLDADSPEGYDDSEASTTMGDTPGSESGTY